MERKLVTIEELKATIIAKILKLDNCIKCEMEKIQLLPEPDEEGCNWSKTFYLLTVFRGHTPSNEVQRIVADARKQYNLKADEDT